MCKIIYFMCVAANIAIACSWDFAITTKTKIKFYNNDGTLQGVEDWQFTDLNAIYYDALNNALYFVDNERENASISSLNLSKREYKQIIKRRPGESILGIAFDPLTEMLFWVNPTNKSILMVSLSPGIDNNSNGQVLLQMKYELPHAIAVDICKRYIYWTNVNITNPTIERSRFDGSQRQVIVHEYLTMPVSVIIDQESQRIYWVDLEEGLYFSIGSIDFGGENRKVIYSGMNQQVTALAIKNYTLYWTDRHMFVWSYPITNKLKGTTRTELIKVTSFKEEEPLGIVTHIDLQQQTLDVPECKYLIKTFLDKNISVNDNKGTFSQMNASEYCLRNRRLNISSRLCKELCYTYCLEGECVINSQGNPQCIYSNNFDILTQKNLTSDDTYLTYSEVNPPDYTGRNTSNNFQERDYIIIFLGIFCGLLSLLCALLFFQISKLKKRPRIKKRVVINKNTALNCKPESCEIIIENCCNMNINETPCFATEDRCKANH